MEIDWEEWSQRTKTNIRAVKGPFGRELTDDEQTAIGQTVGQMMKKKVEAKVQGEKHEN